MSQTSKGAASKQKAESCPKCTKVVSDKDLALQCEVCSEWFHIKCQTITEAEYKFLDEHSSIHWYCVTCNKNVASMIQIMSSLKQRQEKVEQGLEEVKKDVSRILLENKSIKEANAKLGSDWEEFKKGVLPDEVIKRFELEIGKNKLEFEGKLQAFDQELSKLKEVNNSLETKLETAIEAKLVEEIKQPTFADMVSRQVDSKLQRVSGDLNKVQETIEIAKQRADEEKDRESRGNNIIVYRVPEENVKEVRNEKDKSFCLEMFNDALGQSVCEGDIKSMFRLGKRDDTNPNVRPLLIQFRERVTKNRVMESLFKLKSASDLYKNVSVTHDLTRSERDACKALIEEAKIKQSEETGEYLWRVRGLPGQMRVIRLRKH